MSTGISDCRKGLPQRQAHRGKRVPASMRGHLPHSVWTEYTSCILKASPCFLPRDRMAPSGLVDRAEIGGRWGSPHGINTIHEPLPQVCRCFRKPNRHGPRSTALCHGCWDKNRGFRRLQVQVFNPDSGQLRSTKATIGGKAKQSEGASGLRMSPRSALQICHHRIEFDTRENLLSSNSPARCIH